MPENQNPPADDAAGNPPKDGGTAGDPPKAPEAPKPIVFQTQAELDRIIEDRVRRARPADYDELKTKAGEYDKAQEAAKTELQREQDARKAAEAASATALATANQRLKVTEIKLEALAQNSLDADIVVALLSSSGDIEVDKDGNVLGVKEAVKKLLKDKPVLVKPGTPPRSGSEFGGNDQASVKERIAELERAGKWSEARDLKMASALGAAK